LLGELKDILIMSHIVRIWDLPTRLFHWLLALSVGCSLVTAWVGGSAMEWHFRSGYLVISLLLFRLIWGFAGGYWSKWSRLIYFVVRPWQIWLYVRQHLLAKPLPIANDHVDTSFTDPTQANPSDPATWTAGHSPLGALAVLVMLLILVVQVSTGLISDDEITWAGPLTAWVSSAWVSFATTYHKTWGEWLIVGLIVLHVVAIAAYQWFKGQQLLKPMIWGDKMMDHPMTASRDSWVNRIIGLACFAVCVVAVAWAFLV
jgi:cytochrome b